MATAEKTQEDKAESVKDLALYLHSPKKKLKKYVILALSRRMSRDVAMGIEKFIKVNYKAYGFHRAKSLDDLKRQVFRQLSLIVVDDSFDEQEQVMAAIKNIRQKKRGDPVPVFFLTTDPVKLGANYQKQLDAFQKVDDFSLSTRESLPQILSKLKDTMDGKVQRNDSHYKVELPVLLGMATVDEVHKGLMTDLSVYHAMVRCQGIDRFNVGERIKLSIPIQKLLPPSRGQGDFLSIQAIVEKVFIDGRTAYFSFDKPSQEKKQLLTEIVIQLARRYLG